MLTVGTDLPRSTIWSPHPGPQTLFLHSACYEALYGGAAGGGKSDALLVGALWGVHLPGYSAILFRRTFPELEKNLIPRSHELFRGAFRAARYNDQRRVWVFPSGARIHFGHLEAEEDVRQHQSAQYQYIGFDELTMFTEKQYVFMLSRARSPSGIPVYIRSATNPGGEGHDWVFRRWAPWLDPTCPAHAEPGRSSWYLPESDGGERWVEQGTPRALSRVFVPARLTDNPTLAGNDPRYEMRLAGLDPVTRAQLREGNWLAHPSVGMLFNRGWFTLVDAAPAEVLVRIRYWDRAATRPHDGNKDPDWTRGVKLSLGRDGIWTVEHVASERDRPHMVKRLVRQTAELDGKRCVVGIEQDPGQAGVAEAHDYARELVGWNVRLYRPTGDKITRAQPVSAQAGAGNLRMVRGHWNTSFLNELESFPDGGHDDQVDSLSGAFNAILLLKQAHRMQPITMPISWLG